MNLPASEDELKNTLYHLGYFPEEKVICEHWKQLRARGRAAMHEMCNLYPGLKPASDEIFFYTFFPYHLMPSNNRFAFADLSQAIADRHNMGISYESIAKDIGLSRETVRSIVTGEAKPKEETKQKIRQWLSRSSSTLVL